MVTRVLLVAVFLMALVNPLFSDVHAASSISGDIVISSATIWPEETYNLNSLTVSNGATLSIAGGSTLNVSGTLTANGSSTILLQGKNTTTQVNDSWVGTGVTVNAGNIQVDAGSKISADGQGYVSVGPGTSTSIYTGCSYGGLGSSGGPATYGSALMPTNPGSGGAGNSNGGGVIRLIVSGTLTNNGAISANGWSQSWHTGASGGSIWVTTGALVGNGNFTADGNNSGYSSGGGGRVAVYYKANSGFTGFTTSTANGAENGSVAFVDNSQTYNRLYVYKQFPFVADTVAIYDSITVDNGGTLYVGGGSDITITGTITVSGNSTILVQSKNNSDQVGGQWQGMGATLRAGNIQVDAGSRISADGQGYVGVGPGSSSSIYTGSSYGGAGSNSGPATYGSALTPVDLGSGGAGSTSGGGAIRLIVSGTLINNGAISAGGAGGYWQSSASGGSIYVTTGTLAGTGTIAANGLNGGYSNGGGGRVAVYYTTNSGFNLALVTANSGIGGAAAGTAGTVYAFGAGTPDHGHVTVSNNLVLPENSTVTLDSITVNNSSTIAIGNNSTISVKDITVTGDGIASGAIFKVGGGSAVNVSGTIHVSGNSTILLQSKNNTAQIEGAWQGSGVTVNAGNIQVDAGSKISADGQGYVSVGPGTSTSIYTGCSYGGHGSSGGPASYGSALMPVDLGSGGSGTSNGGGVIRLIVSGTLTNNGTISANGSSYHWHSGASGGSVWVTTGTLAGAGIFTAEGYGGGYSSGGGGRVAVYYKINGGFTGFTTSAANGAENGSIAFNDNSQTYNRLYVYKQFPFFADTTATYDSITVDNGGTLYVGGGSEITVNGTITVTGKSTILVQSKNNSGQVGSDWQGAGASLKAGNIQVDAESNISADGQGYVGVGPGSSSSIYTGSSYGGTGSNGGPATYGSALTPVDLGSGGSPATAGGGAVLLIVSGTLTNNGTISANGSGYYWHSSASGGSILASTGTLTGTGTISANGSNGGYSNGGGGRVAVYYKNNSFDPVSITASPGGGGAEAGTVLLSNTPKFLWIKPVGDLMHDTGRLEWAALAVDPLTTTVDIVASRATVQHVLGVHLNSNSGVDWDTRSVADGQYELRLIFRDANGLVIGEAPRTVLINNSVTWHWGTVASNETWSAGKVHVIEGMLIIPSGVTVNVDPGTVIKAQKGARIVVQDGGIFNALGTDVSRIIFTALDDDSIGGDTNLDGNQTKPLAGEWFGFGIQGSGQMNLNSYTDIRYMQTVRSGTLTADEKWLGSYLYHVTGDVTVPTGISLTIEPGTVIKFDAGKGITVQAGGKLVADGTIAQPIWFTSVKDDSVGGDTNNDGNVTTPVAGDWRGLSFGGGLGSLKHVMVRYGGDATGSTAAISATNATVGIANSEISEGMHEGVLVYSGSIVTMDSCVITGFDRGINAQTGGQITIRNTTIDGNRYGVLFHGGTMDLTNSIISNSLERGIWSNCCGGPSPIIRYTDVWSTTGINYYDYGANTDLSGTNGNISKDPKYRNQEQRDFRLNFLSPAIDAADGAVAPATDMMGAPRFNDPRTPVKTGIAVNGTYSDMGAFEFSDNAPSDVDLIVSSVTGPASAVVGGQTTLSWTIANKGTGYAVGPWHDTVYLVSNPDTHPVDIVAGEVLVGNNPPLVLGPGQSYTASGTVRVPGSVVASHRWAVKTNSKGEVFEGLNSSNNRGVSANTVELDLPALVLDGATLTSQFTGVGHSYWYKINPGAGKDVSISLKLSGNSGTSQLYIGQGYMPDPQHYDIKSSEWNSATATALIPGSSSQIYYIQIIAESLTGAAADFTLAAKSIAFSLASVIPGSVSNTGSATFELFGGQLNSNARYLLIDQSGQTRSSATSIFLVNPAHLYATFSMLGLTPGVFDFKVDDGGKISTLDNAITVTAGKVGQIEYSLEVPKALRAGKSGKITINYRNVGSSDVIAPLMWLSANGANLNQIAPECTGCSSDFKKVYETIFSSGAVLGINHEGPAGVLPPGSNGSITLNMQQNISSGTINHTLSTVTDPNRIIDWAGIKNSLRPSFVPIDAWDAIYANFTTSVGTTVGQFNTVLANNATYLSRLGRYEQSASSLFSFELMKSGLSQISNRYELGDFGRGSRPAFGIRGELLNGSPAIRYPSGGSRIFIADKANPDQYVGAMGDYARLVLNGDKSWDLTEKDGTRYHFILNQNVAGQMILDYMKGLNGNQISLQYTTGRVSGLIDSTGDAYSISYNDKGRVSNITDQVGWITSYDYDSSGEHLLKVSDASGTIGFSYISGQGAAREHALHSITYQNGTNILFEYDLSGRLTRRYLDSSSESLTLVYGAEGDVTITDKAGNSSHLMMDEYGKIAQLTDPLGESAQAFFDAEHKLSKVTGPSGATYSLGYDTNGNVTTLRDPSGNQHTMGYNGFGSLQSLTDSLGNTLRYTYDASDNSTGVTSPDGSSEQGVYDARGNLTRYVNRRGKVVELLYNSKNQLIKKTFADGKTLELTYDNHRNLLTSTNSAGTTSFTYDAADRVTKVTYPNARSLQYSYDPLTGRRLSMKDQSGFTVKYSYDDVGRLVKITDGNGSTITGYSYDTAARLSRKDMGNGTYTTIEYDKAGQQLHLVNYNSGGTVLSRFDYTYDALGRRTAMSTLEGSWSYGYDSVGQLISVTPPDGKTLEYSYDAAGNRSRVNDNGVATDYATNNLNQYVSAGSATYRYDADGNMISKTAGGQNWSYSYDDENRLLAMTGPDGTRAYEYDSLGNRIAETHNGQKREYLIDPIGYGDVIAEYDGNGSLVAHYTHGLSLTSAVSAGGTAAYYHFDGSSNTAQMTNSAGSVVNSYSYLPFGEKRNSTETIENPFTFVGQFGVMDQGNGFYFMRNRWYDPTTGRFTQPDPIGIAGGDSTLYRYVGNNPLTAIDPVGMVPCDPKDDKCWEEYERKNWGPEWAARIDAKNREIARINANYAQRMSHIANTNLNIFKHVENGYYVFDKVAPIVPGVGEVLTGVKLIVIVSEGIREGDPWAIKDAGVEVFKAYAGKKFEALGYVAYGSKDLANYAFGLALDHANDFLQCLWENKNSLSSLAANALGLVSQAGTSIIGSWDPNEKSTVGYGPEGYVTGSDPLFYTVIYENKSTATAPAYKVVVKDQLDTNLDWSTLELVSIGFNNMTLDIPTGLQAYSTTASVTTDLNPVKVTAVLNPSTGLMTWTMESIDPVTGTTPEDPFAGFLPPNDATHRGEGIVTFRIKPKSGLAHGTAITNKAQIFFDTNPVIETNSVTNTIDLTAPTSSVTTLPDIIPSTSFTVNWSGNDTGSSGIASYDVYVKTDTGSFVPWLTGTTATSATFNGVIGHSYSFYSVSTDNVGHRQTSIPASTTTTLSGKVGDCDASGTVTIAEVQSAINMFLGLKTVAACVDTSGDNAVSIAEVQKTINSFLGL